MPVALVPNKRQRDLVVSCSLQISRQTLSCMRRCTSTRSSGKEVMRGYFTIYITSKNAAVKGLGNLTQSVFLAKPDECLD